MIGGKRSRDNWKVAAGIACGAIVLTGLAAKSYWCRAGAAWAQNKPVRADTTGARSGAATSLERYRHA
jgi:hypothetical protein